MMLRAVIGLISVIFSSLDMLLVDVIDGTFPNKFMILINKLLCCMLHIYVYIPAKQELATYS